MEVPSVKDIDDDEVQSEEMDPEFAQAVAGVGQTRGGRSMARFVEATIQGVDKGRRSKSQKPKRNKHQNKRGNYF